MKVMAWQALPKTSGCSAAWLARLLGVQEVVGSNPASPIRLRRIESRG